MNRDFVLGALVLAVVLIGLFVLGVFH